MGPYVPAPCIVTQNDSPSVGVDLLRDWLGTGAPVVVNFFLCIFYLKYFFSMQGRALLSKPSLQCIDQGSVLNVHAFRTTHVCTALIRVLYFMCTHSVLHMFALHFCALHG